MPDPALFRQGDAVRLLSRRDLVGTITAPPRRVSGEYWYTVNFGPGNTATCPENDLEPSTCTTDIVTLLLRGQFAGREAFAKLVTHLKLTASLRSQIYALLASRTRFYSYQFKPVLKFLESDRHRLLIADEVGLGKTIEAGLILTELRARRSIRRVLIVPPAHLIPKWQRELKTRFDLDFEILGRADVERFLRQYEEEGNEATLRGIVSLQTLRARPLMARWEAVAPQLDFVVFDEAGRLRNRETQSNRAASLLGETADALLLLTATPVQTGTQDLFHLVHLLDPDEFADWVVFYERLFSNEPILAALGELRLRFPPDSKRCAEHLRQVQERPLGDRFLKTPIYHEVLRRLEQPASFTRRDVIDLQRDISTLNVLGQILSRTRKRDVHEARPFRRARVVRAAPTAAEQEFYDAVTALCREAYRRTTQNTLAGFLTIMPQRQMASCMVAMVDYLKERIAPTEEYEETSDLTVEDFEGNEGERPDSGIQWARLGNLDEWRRRLSESDTKCRILLEALQEVHQQEPSRSKVVVFSYFKKTLRYLEQRLAEAGIPAIRIDGDVPSRPDDPEQDIRGQCLQRFRDDRSIRVLLSSEVGSEGLDMEFCNVLINYDLPWNPMVVEQRIGRVDRIGQDADRITIVNLSMPGTIEDRILERLYARVEIFERSIGDLETILGEEVRRLTHDLFARTLSPAELDARLDQAAMAVEHRRAEMEAMERQASALIGHDEYFLDQIEQARRYRRYVGGEELLVYVRDFLAAHHRSCTITDQPRESVYRFAFDEPFRGFLRATLAQEDAGLRSFFRRCRRNEVDITTDPVVADRDKSLDFLTFYHPVIRVIKEYYSMHPEELFPVSRVSLTYDGLKPGDYAWFLFLTEITGAKPHKELELVVIAHSTGEAVSEDESDALIWEMVQKGRTPDYSDLSNVNVSTSIIDAAHETLAARLKEEYERRQRLNEAIVDGRLASLDEGYKRNRRKREELLQRARERGRQERYIRMLEAGLRNLEEEYQRRRDEIEAGRRLGRSFQLRGAGILRLES